MPSEPTEPEPSAETSDLFDVALSYAGGLAIAVRADAERFPDVDILTAAMTHDWRALAPSPLSPTRSPETTVAGRSHAPDRRRPRLTRSAAGAGPP